MEENKELLVKYITEAATPEECLRVEAWLDADPANQAEYLTLVQTWRDARIGGDPALLDADKAYETLRLRLSLPQERGVVRPMRRFYRVAAMLGGIAVLTSMIYYGMSRRRQNAPAAIADVIVVPKGLKKHVFLPDSTELWLNAGSTLRIDAGYGVTGRHVFLDGEAFFKVRHDSSMVFTVETRNYIIRDIGTAFNVNTYTEDARFEAAVIEGAISVEGRFSKNRTESRIVLSHDQVLTVRKETASSTADSLSSLRLNQSPAIERYAGWTADELSFDDDSFRDIAKRLERRYDVSICIADTALANYHFTGSFKGLPDIRSMLDVMQETTPLIYEIKHDTVFMRRRN